ncbi:YlmC/YmxH family sporulation protein [Ruminococcus sp.]|uniref:YlmC/YmxH family sporulation protein n=1 Tax=Ruminococcus sp. TaxID=41978 RepID=UPI0025D4A668|nr:YlmC/YmxH family sporulation protein [Ruminococcus sp.]MBQ6252920.1 YlmC/YmxH family sporulation protein [Ruminococcus sp.]MBR6996114.1 YlmC/YmxH family sporulation protein [Ruminococcus sp.]
MQVCFDEICRKEVVDIVSGERLGFIDDIELDISDGRVASLVIYGSSRLFGLFGRDEDTVLTCDEIRVVGDDIILVERSAKHHELKSLKKRRNSLSSLLK